MRATIVTCRRGSGGSPGHEGSCLIRRLLYAAFFFEVGLLLVVLPWSGFWDRNYFGEAWPGLRALMTNNFVRGGVTGLGVVNLCAGLLDLSRLFSLRRRHDVP